MIGEEAVLSALRRGLGRSEHPHERETARAAISAHLEALERVGWVVVPREPTGAMRMAGARAICEQKCFRADILGEPCINPETHRNAPCKANATQLLLSFRASAALSAYGEMVTAAPPPQNSDEVKP